MASVDPRIRQIKIKTGIVKRLGKEKEMYKKEAEQENQRLQKMISEERDVHDINKQKEVLEESKMMIPDCGRRLKKAYDDLKQALETEKDLAEAPEYQDAEKMLSETIFDN